MKFPLKHENVMTITAGEKVIAVSSLPEEIRNEIYTLDAFNQQKMDQYLEIEKIELAIIAKKQQVELLVTNYLKPKEPTAEDVAANDQEGTGDGSEKSTKTKKTK